MTSVAEAATAKGQLAADIAAGVNTLSQDQTIRFTKYVKLVLPMDGYVFWVKADLLSQSALLNAAIFNKVVYNEPPRIITPAATLDVKGSLHYATKTNQNEDETVGVNTVVFTALSPVEDFNQIGPTVMFIATLEPDGVRFAFSERKPFYQQADTYHYVGNAVYSAMANMLVDSLDGFSTTEVVVSNSLPIWLSMNDVSSPAADIFGNKRIRLYPSFLVPDNLEPIYGSVHIEPSQTRAMQAAPYLDQTLSHYQLASDTVRITIYGTRNFEALDFLDFVNQFSLFYGTLGIMNMPIVRDEKRTQNELSIIAMKKTIEFEVSYYQKTARDIARQLILEATASFIVADQPPN